MSLVWQACHAIRPGPIASSRTADWCSTARMARAASTTPTGCCSPRTARRSTPNWGDISMLRALRLAILALLLTAGPAYAQKISELPAGDQPVDASLLPMVQSGVMVQVTAEQLLGYIQDNISPGASGILSDQDYGDI